MKQKTVYDVFCGCGGLSYGFIKAGYKVLLGVDHDLKALRTYERNHPGSAVLHGDLRKMDKRKLNGFANGGVDVLTGGVPCQGVSLSGHRLREDPRNELFNSYLGILSAVRPRAFVMENVPGLVGLFNGELKDFLLEHFGKLGYTVSYQIINASLYGVPQSRRRVFFVGLLDGGYFEFPKPLLSDPVTSLEALSDLPEYGLPDGSAYKNGALSPYQKLMRLGSEGIFNHAVTNHRPKTRNIISLVPDGGNYKNLPPELQNTRKVNIAWTRFDSRKPGCTIDTGHRHHFHYEYNRVPTVRESARIQSFPDSFIFEGDKTSQYRQVGNAVPPLLAEIIAKKLLDYL